MQLRSYREINIEGIPFTSFWHYRNPLNKIRAPFCIVTSLHAWKPKNSISYPFRDYKFSRLQPSSLALGPNQFYILPGIKQSVTWNWPKISNLVLNLRMGGPAPPFPHILLWLTQGQLCFTFLASGCECQNAQSKSHSFYFKHHFYVVKVSSCSRHEDMHGEWRYIWVH